MKPRIFVSSTFYDLKYIREDLSNFIKSYNFEPIMFEDGDIGYVPGKPFFVIATQNPVESAGVFPLPEAQMDRFMMKLSMGMPCKQEELEILERYMSKEPLADLESVMSLEELLEARAEAKKEAEAQAEHLHIIIDYGVKENGETRPATPEEKAEFESWAE